MLLVTRTRQILDLIQLRRELQTNWQSFSQEERDQLAEYNRTEMQLLLTKNEKDPETIFRFEKWKVNLEQIAKINLTDQTRINKSIGLKNTETGEIRIALEENDHLRLYLYDSDGKLYGASYDNQQDVYSQFHSQMKDQLIVTPSWQEIDREEIAKFLTLHTKTNISIEQFE